MGTTAGLGALGLVLIVMLIVLALLWILMPFLIMGTNGRLDTLIKNQRRIIELLEQRSP